MKEQLINIVKEASKLMLCSDFEISEKDGAANIVTSADIAVQRFLRTELNKLFPEAGFLCEEEDFNDTESEYYWVIDPIDGTTNFSRGIGECAISVALVHKKKAVLGVVYNPYLDDMFSAEAGRGAELNGKPISVSERPFEGGLFCTAASLYRKEFAKICFDIISDVHHQCNDFRRIGTCALELCYLAAGKCELYFEIRVFPWDYAAGLLILREAGGVIYGFDREEPLFDKPTVLVGANNRENFERLNSIVLKYLDKVPYKE